MVASTRSDYATIAGFVPTRRVRERVGGGSAQIASLFGGDEEEAPPPSRTAASTRSNMAQPPADPGPREASSGFVPTRKVREPPGASAFRLARTSADVAFRQAVVLPRSSRFSAEGTRLLWISGQPQWCFRRSFRLLYTCDGSPQDCYSLSYLSRPAVCLLFLLPIPQLWLLKRLR